MSERLYISMSIYDDPDHARRMAFLEQEKRRAKRQLADKLLEALLDGRPRTVKVEWAEFESHGSGGSAINCCIRAELELVGASPETKS